MAVAKQRGGRGNLLFIQRGALPGVGALAGRVLLQAAKEAVTTGDDKRDHHPVAFLQRLHFPARLHHFAHELVAKNIAVFNFGDLPAVEMQIRSADRRGRYAQDNIVRLFNNRIGDILDTNMMWTVVRECFHATSERIRVSI